MNRETLSNIHKTLSKRDCEHGRQLGKCDTCDLAEAEKRIAELEKERETLLAFIIKRVPTIRAMSTVSETSRIVADEADSLLEAHNLEQQAKGVELFIKSEAEALQRAPWFKDAKPTLEYLYDADFGLTTCSKGVTFANQLRSQSKTLKEQNNGQ